MSKTKKPALEEWYVGPDGHTYGFRAWEDCEGDANLDYADFLLARLCEGAVPVPSPPFMVKPAETPLSFWKALLEKQKEGK